MRSSTPVSKANTATAKSSPASSHASVSFRMSQPSSPAILSPSRLTLHGYPDGPDQIMSDAAHKWKHRGEAIERQPFQRVVLLLRG